MTDTPSLTSKATKATGTKRTAKSVAAKNAAVGAVSLRWELAELPSSQHKAGLAGLALCVKFLQRRPDRKGTCDIEAIDAAGLTLRVDRAGMQSLFDDVYAASMQEEERGKKLQKKRRDGSKVDIEPKRSIEQELLDKKGVAKTRTIHIYDQCVPRGALVDEWDSAPAGSPKLWLKLWRDVVWTTLRGVPATREPYECRAEARPATDGADAWDELVTRPSASIELPSTYYLGAQAKSAENASFRDIARSRFLLHFWPFVVSIYVPAIVQRDGDRDFVGFAMAVPDVADLDGFVADWEKVARERGSEASGYRPRDAVIDVAAEAGLDVARRTFAVLGRKEATISTSPWLTAVDVFHIEKEGNNVRVRSVSRVDLVRERADAYALAREAYWTPLFRRQRIINILEGHPWWYGFGRVAATTPEDLTIGNSKFRRDCRAAFTEVEMSEAKLEDEKTLEHLIYQTTRAYVFGRLASKYELKWDSALAQKDPNWKKKYEEMKEKVARDAFLAVRSRTGADFVTYFTSTICSVPQRLNEKAFIEVARALHDEQQVERIRSLTLLALSASA